MSQVLDTNSIKDDYLNSVAGLELVQDEIMLSLSELASPSYYSSNLPTFTKRAPLVVRGDTTSTSDNKNNRSNKLQDAIRIWKGKLNEIKNQFESREIFQSDAYQDNLQIIQQQPDSFPYIMPPDLSILDTTLAGVKDQTVKKTLVARIDLVSGWFKDIINKIKSTCKHQWILSESSSNTQQTCLEVLLKTFYRELYHISITVKDFYDKRLTNEAKLFSKYLENEQSIALRYQAKQYKENFQLIAQQHDIFEEMIDCLNDELEMLATKERIKLKKLLDELKRKNNKLYQESKVHCQVSYNVVLSQPYSLIFYKECYNWLYEYQRVLIEALKLMVQKSREEDPSLVGVSSNTLLEHKSAKYIGTGSLAQANRSMNDQALVQKSALFNYAKRMEPSKFTNYAAASVTPLKQNIMEILVGFTQFHLKSNQANLQKVQEVSKKIQQQYSQLKEQVKKIEADQQILYSSKDMKLPSIQDSTLGKGGLSSLVNKKLLQLDNDKKICEAKIRQHWDALKNDYDVECARLEQQNGKLTKIVEYLKQYNGLMRDWDERIKLECNFVEKWKELRRRQSSFISAKFMEWNHFVTEEVDIFYQTISLYSAGFMSSLKENANDFMSQALELWNESRKEIEDKMKLIDNLDFSKQDIQVNDVLIATQGQIREWIDSMTLLYQDYFQYRFGSLVVYYLNLLDNLLDQFDERSELCALLDTLDNMYDFDRQDQMAEKETRRFNYTNNHNPNL